MSTATMKRIRNEIRTPVHTVWFEPKTATFEIVAENSKRLTTCSVRAVCEVVWPGKAVNADLNAVRDLSAQPFLDVPEDDPREAVAE